MNTTSIHEKVSRGIQKNKDNRRRISLQPKRTIMSFKSWLKRNRIEEDTRIGDTVVGDAIQDTVFGFVPATETPEGRAQTIDLLAKAIFGMTGDITITAVSVIPGN